MHQGRVFQVESVVKGGPLHAPVVSENEYFRKGDPKHLAPRPGESKFGLSMRKENLREMTRRWGRFNTHRFYRFGKLQLGGGFKRARPETGTVEPRLKRFQKRESYSQMAKQEHLPMKN